MAAAPRRNTFPPLLLLFTKWDTKPYRRGLQNKKNKRIVIKFSLEKENR